MTRWRTRRPAGYVDAAILAASIGVSGVALAQDAVTITGEGGTPLVAGEVVGFDGRNLRLATEFGEVTLDYGAVICSGAACPDPDAYVPRLRFSGARRLGEVILPALIDGYARSVGGSVTREDGSDGTVGYGLLDEGGEAILDVSLRVTTTDDGLADLLALEADVVMAARDLTEEERTLAAEAGFDLRDRSRMLALDALVPVVSPVLGLRDITPGALADIHAGNTVSWDALGAEPGPIAMHLISRETGQTQDLIDTLFLGAAAGGDVTYHDTLDGLLTAVAEGRGAIGLAPFGDIGSTRQIGLVGRCGRPAPATVETIKTEDYPLTMPLYLIGVDRMLHPREAAFLDWLGTGEAQLILRRAGVLTQDPVPIPLDRQGERLASAIAQAGVTVPLGEVRGMTAGLRGRVRLSLTFRFETGDAALAAPSLSHVEFLATAIEEGAYDDRTLYFLGFSDGDGPAAENLTLSRERAGVVRDAVVAALGGTVPDGLDLRIEGYGEMLPIACDDAAWGREVNRRVELWVGAAE